MKLKFRAYIPKLAIYLNNIHIYVDGDIGTLELENVVKLPYYIDWDESEIRKDLGVGESELILRFYDLGDDWICLNSKDIQLQVFLDNEWIDFEVDNE